MVKKIRFQEIRATRGRRGAPRGFFVLEPLDAALIGAAIAALMWLQWFTNPTG
jgi:hypothetical protein